MQFFHFVKYTYEILHCSLMYGARAVVDLMDMYVGVYVCMYVYVFAYVFMNISMFMYVYACVCIYACVAHVIGK